MGVVELLHRFKEDPRLRWSIVAVNLVGIAYGFWYYRFQFLATDPWWWLVVPDSPMAVLLATVPLVLYGWGWRSDVLDAIAVVANVKVGVWTAFVLVYYPSFGAFQGPLVTNLDFWLFWGHLGMALEAGVFLHDLRPLPARWWGILAGGFLLQDALDYVLVDPGYFAACDGLRTMNVPCDPAREPALTAVAFGLTLITFAGLWWYLRGKELEERGRMEEAPTAPEHL